MGSLIIWVRGLLFPTKPWLSRVCVDVRTWGPPGLGRAWGDGSWSQIPCLSFPLGRPSSSSIGRKGAQKANILPHGHSLIPLVLPTSLVNIITGRKAKYHEDACISLLNVPSHSARVILLVVGLIGTAECPFEISSPHLKAYRPHDWVFASGWVQLFSDWVSVVSNEGWRPKLLATKNLDPLSLTAESSLSSKSIDEQGEQFHHFLGWTPIGKTEFFQRWK